TLQELNSDSCFHSILVVREPYKSIWSRPPLPASKNRTFATSGTTLCKIIFPRPATPHFNQQPHSITWAQRHVGRWMLSLSAH
ncbi:hypothetical protein ARMGADRAFT_1009334, partial [Armillaria gallica]